MERDASLERVVRFLEPIGVSKGEFLGAAELIVDAAQRHEGVASAIHEVLGWLSKPVVDERTVAIYQRMRRPGTGDELPGPDGTSVWVAVVYMRARKALSGEPGFETLKESLSTPDRFLETVKGGLGRFNPAFLGELLLETELRASRDPEFARELEAAQMALQELSPALGELAQKTPPPPMPPEKTTEHEHGGTGGPSGGSGGGGTGGGSGQNYPGEPVGGTICSFSGKMDTKDWICIAIAIGIIVLLFIGGSETDEDPDDPNDWT